MQGLIRMHGNLNCGQRRTVQRVETVGFARIQNRLRSTGDRLRYFYRAIAVEGRFLCFGKKSSSGLGCFDSLSIRMKEPCPDPLFKVLDLFRKTGLGCARPIGGAGDVQIFPNDDSCSQQTEI